MLKLVPAIGRFVLALCLLLGGVGHTSAGGSGEVDPNLYRDELPPVSRRYTAVHEAARLDKLRAEFGRNKEVPTEYELQALLALSHFPSLKEVRIRFTRKDYAFPISSIPRPLSTFRRPLRRTYLIRIDTEMTGPRTALLLENQPFNAQVGILGHELAHTAYYIHRSFFGILGDGICFLVRSCRNQFERDTDIRLVEHRLGWQRYDHSSFVRAGFRRNGIESDGGGGAYMGPSELLEVMEQTGMYDVSRAEETPNAAEKTRGADVSMNQPSDT